MSPYGSRRRVPSVLRAKGGPAMGLILRQPDPNPESGPAASVPADPAVPTPLTRERVIALFKERGWRYFIDSEGDLGGIWDDATFYFFFHGEMKEIFWIHAQYPGTVDAGRLGVVRDVLEDSHRRRPWPMAHYRIDDDGDIRIYAERAVDYEHGVTDDQLALHVYSAIASATGLFSRLDEALGR